MTYQINLPVFEGPFDLLLHLVKVNEMEISDINVAEITDQYLKTIQMMQELDLEVAGEFLVMAATLINLKVRALLPEPPGEDEEAETEEISEIMSAKALMEQLIEYRRFKELSVELGGRQEEQMRLFYRNSLLPALQEAQENPPLKAELNLLFDCFGRVLRYVESLPHHDVAFEPFSVEERVGMLRERLRAAQSLELFALFRQCRNKADMIVTFLALLELSRLKEVHLEQTKVYEEVFVYRREPDQPPSEAPSEGPGEVLPEAPQTASDAAPLAGRRRGASAKPGRNDDPRNAESNGNSAPSGSSQDAQSAQFQSPMKLRTLSAEDIQNDGQQT